MPWYSMTAVYHWEQMGSTLPKFERRTTICSAKDEEEATGILLTEAQDYPTSEHIVFLGEYTIQELDEEPSREPVEVAHELNIGVEPNFGTIIGPERFLDAFWDASRIEDCEALGLHHVWHNRDNKTSGCYNCRKIELGRLWEDQDGPKPAEQDVPPKSDRAGG